MRPADVRMTLNVYRDVVTDEIRQAHSKVVGLALDRARGDFKGFVLAEASGGRTHR